MNPARDILFLSHGAPSLLTRRSQARRRLEGLGPVLSGARAVAAVPAHWESRPVKVTTAARPHTVHHFRALGGALRRRPGAPDRAPAHGASHAPPHTAHTARTQRRHGAPKS